MNLTDLLLLQDHLDKRGSGWFVLVALLETERFRFRLFVVQLRLKLPAKVRHRSGNDDLAFLLLLYMLRHLDASLNSFTTQTVSSSVFG